MSFNPEHKMIELGIYIANRYKIQPGDISRILFTDQLGPIEVLVIPETHRGITSTQASALEFERETIAPVPVVFMDGTLVGVGYGPKSNVLVIKKM